MRGEDGVTTKRVQVQGMMHLRVQYGQLGYQQLSTTTAARINKNSKSLSNNDNNNGPL